MTWLAFVVLGGRAEAGSPRIINGVVATEADYPSAGALIVDFVDYDLRYVLCSSTLIAPDTVLAAGHCQTFQAYFGNEKLDVYWTRQADLTAIADGDGSAPLPDDAILATEWVAPKGFALRNITSGIGQADDIALFFLSEPVLDIAPAFVVTAEEGPQVTEKHEVFVTGWGQTEQNSSYGQKYAGASVVGEVGTYEFQVGPETEDVRQCHGDSGGPVFMTVDTESPETFRVVGVTSHTYDESDCNRTGGVNTRVDAYLAFLDAEMRARCEAGTRVWCDVPGLIAPPAPIPEDTGTEDSGTDTAVPEDTAAPLDTAMPEDVEPPLTDDGADEEESGGCGCTTGTAPAFWSVWLPLLALVRRRRAAV
jgi:hypothetical protein